MIWFALASLSPLTLLVLCVAYGASQPWLIWIALLNQTLLVLVLDRIARRISHQTRPLAADALSTVLALGHLVVFLPVVKTAQGLDLAHGGTLLLVLALFMGQISHPNAHELIHHPRRILRRLGLLIYASMLIGHHVSAHLKVHHTHVATRQDPNSARRGEGFYLFFIRAWLGSFLAGYRAETTARARRSTPPQPLSHPYCAYVAVAMLTLTAVTCISGVSGLILYLGVSIYAQAQIFLADYIQHYGLERRLLANQKPEPVGPQHSWNAPHWYSSAMMLNAPRHSDHHQNPQRRFPALRLTQDMPILPHSLPVMAVIALLPPLWRRVMARELTALAAKNAQNIDSHSQ